MTATSTGVSAKASERHERQHLEEAEPRFPALGRPLVDDRHDGFDVVPGPHEGQRA